VLPVELSDLRNRLLAALPPEAITAMAPHLERVDLPIRMSLNMPGQPIAAVFFPERGYVSMLATLENGDAAEVGMAGREGMVGLPLVLGTDRSPIEAMVQSEGTALRMDAEEFQSALREIPALQRLMLRYAMAFNMQVTMTAACNVRHLVEQRLARWLLMAHDRTESDEFLMTHEFLSMMLGVRRAGVTVAVGALHRAGFINSSQGRIRVADRPGLESAACECHVIARDEYSRLLGSLEG